jgi:hypothetical protein
MRGGAAPAGDDDDDAAARAAASAAPGKNPGEGWPGKKAGGGPGGAGPRRPLNIIMALAFSAAAAAAIRLLFSASDSSGDRSRKDGSMHGPGNPKESLKINFSAFISFVTFIIQ